MSKARYQVNMQLDKETKDRVEALQLKGYSVPMIIKEGLKVMEGQNDTN
jgi:hypothetical protein